ncbi:unnamed protein product [Cuscuta campestris]|uniref:HMA domain-containing protein n=1 Tax=Cuscuta campestris TaxID=132261 RepID=A0A484LSP5_9ASTE|nr:unnamed protein product [Cuscuta campestris]
MFLATVGRPRYGEHGEVLWDGKIGIFPFTYEAAAQRSSKNRPAGTMEVKAIPIINRDVMKEMLLNQAAPRSLADLVLAVTIAFEELSHDTLNRVFLTLQGVMGEVLQNKGGNQFKIPHMNKTKMAREGTLPQNLGVSPEVYHTAQVYLQGHVEVPLPHLHMAIRKQFLYQTSPGSVLSFLNNSSMAASSSEAPPPPDEQQQQPPSQSPLPYKTWVLKVPIHCQACKRKVKKVLHTVDGVYITEIDEREHKVTVTGNVEADALIKKLLRSGKTADLWPPPENDKKSKNRKNGDEEEEEEDDGSEEDKEGEKQPPAATHQKAAAAGGATAVRFDLPPHPAPSGDVPDKKKKKNKKKKKKNKKHDDAAGAAAAPPCDGGAPANTGNEAWMVGPPYYPHMYPPPSYYLPPPHHHHPLPPPQQQTAYVVSYNNNNAATHPGGGTAAAHYLAPPTYYTRAEVRAMRCRPLDSFEVLSDENPNACSII